MISEKEILDEFDQLIETQNLEGLLPFLQKNSVEHLEALRKHIIEAKEHWMTYKYWTEEPVPQGVMASSLFGRRGDEGQIRIIIWSAIALLSKKELQQWHESFDFLKYLNNNPLYIQIVEWAKPRWIDSVMAQQFRGRFRTVLPYRVLRTLEQLGLITHHPAIFARSIREHWSYPGSPKGEDAIAMFDRFLEDPLTWQRDIPQLFNYETGLYYVPHLCNYETWLSHISMGYTQLEGNSPFPTWAYLYQKLLSENKMDRRFFIENALLIQTKEWHRYGKEFYQKLLDDIKVEPEEFIEFQTIIFFFFQSKDLPVLTLGLDLCKKMQPLPGFNLLGFLEGINPLMLRVDAKKVIKSTLPFLEKIAKLHPGFRAAIAETVVDLFSIPDMALQERAAATLQKLNVLNSADLREKINVYLPQLLGNVKQTLEPWLDEEDRTFTESAPEFYQYQPQKEKLLTQPIQLPNTWNDILFQIGKFIGSDEPHEAEILLHTFICKRHLFPENYAEQLSPYHKQLEQIFWDIDYKNDLKDFLQCKLPNLNAVYPGRIYREGTRIPLELMEKLLLIAHDKIQHQSQLPLLCEPTHLPYWIEPKVLLQRIIAHEQNDEPIHPLDLSIAIARICREGIEEAIPLLQELDEHLQDLMKFCLGMESNICLHNKTLSEQWMPLVKGSYAEKLALWAVAARTYDPNGVFPEFLEKIEEGVAFVVQAFRPHFYFRAAWEDRILNYSTREVVRVKTWEELAIDQLELFKLPQNLLYSIGLHYNLKPGRGDYYPRADVLFWHSIMPQNPEPLAIELTTSSCRTGDGGRANMQGFLTIIDRPEFWFSETSTLAFACCFLQERKETRFLATEVLIHLIEKRKLDLVLFAEKLTFLISNKYGVLMRCIDALVAIKDISSLYNNVLFTILDTMLGQLKINDKLPLNFKKLLEHYLDIMVKTGGKPSTDTLTFLLQWQDSALLKNLIKQIAKP